MEEQKIYELTMEKFTPEHQIILMVEEMSELTKELIKTLRGKMNREHVLEEMADVEIVLEQMKLIFGKEGFNQMKRKKLDRITERLLSGDIEALK